MKINHSPSPWKYRALISEGLRIFIVTAGRGEVCRIATGAGQPEIEEANARLIAAAPEQFAELVAVRNLLADYVSHQDVEMCAVAERLDAVCAVIAKSKGEA